MEHQLSNSWSKVNREHSGTEEKIVSQTLTHFCYPTSRKLCLFCKAMSCCSLIRPKLLDCKYICTISKETISVAEDGARNSEKAYLRISTHVIDDWLTEYLISHKTGYFFTKMIFFFLVKNLSNGRFQC